MACHGEKAELQREQTLDKFEMFFGRTLADALPQTWLPSSHGSGTWELWPVRQSFPSFSLPWLFSSLERLFPGWLAYKNRCVSQVGLWQISPQTTCLYRGGILWRAPATPRPGRSGDKGKMSPFQVFMVFLSVERVRHGWLSLNYLPVGTQEHQSG